MTDYFFSGSQYIRVSRGDTGPGTVNEGPVAIQPNWQWPDNFGANGIDAALYSGSKCYFFKGAQYVRVTRNGTVNAGQQDFSSPQPISQWGWPDGFGTEGIDAALWSGPVTYFFKGQQYIRVTRQEAEFGTVDPGFPAPISNWGFPSGFGTNGIKGALYSGTVCYFFDGPNFIRVHRGIEGPGYVDAGYPRAIKDVWGWPDGFGANGIDAALYSGGSLVTQPTPITGNNNYFFWDNGNPLLGVKAVVNLDETFSSTSTGFSFQLNTWSEEGANNLVNWQQFILWDEQGGTALGAQLDFFVSPDENNVDEVLRSLKTCAVVPVATTIAQGSQLQLTLTYGGNGIPSNNVSGCTFTVLNPNGSTLGSVDFPVVGTPNFQSGQPLTAADTAPIVAFSFAIGGETGGGQGVIAAGSAGTVTYSATNPLTVLTSMPSDVTFRGGTGENANILWGPLPTLAQTSITQGFRADFRP